ncbi:MAG: DUF2277 domain-containing protein [Burkholderiaceae bacterium]
MCRNIRTLLNFEPPATEREIRDASLQFVRKLSGFNAPSKANEAVFDQAVDDVALMARRLITSLVTNAVPKSREVEEPRGRSHEGEGAIGAALRCVSQRTSVQAGSPSAIDRGEWIVTPPKTFA